MNRYRRPLLLLAATLLFMMPLLLLPLTSDARADAWQPVGLRGETVLALSVASSGGERLIYAETLTGLWRFSPLPAVGGVPEGGDFAASADWQRLDGPLPRTVLGGPALATWRVVPGRGRQLYTVTGTGTARQLYRSDDGGLSWLLIGPAPGQNERPPLVVLAGLGSGPDTIALGTDSRVQRSTDGGATWAPGGPWPTAGQSQSPSEPHKPAVRSLLSESNTSDRLYALTEGGSLWVSETSGLAWRIAQPPAPSSGDRNNALTDVPVIEQPVTALAVASSFGTRVWAARADGLAYSSDAGITWTYYALPRGDKTPGGLLTGEKVKVLLVDPRVPETLFAALADGSIYRGDGMGSPCTGTAEPDSIRASADNGLICPSSATPWTYIGRPGARYVTALALDPDTRGVLYAATSDGVWARTVIPLQPTPAPVPTQTDTPLPTATSLSAGVTPRSAASTSTPTPTPSGPSPTATGTATSSATAAATVTRTPTQTPTIRFTFTAAPTPTETPVRLSPTDAPATPTEPPSPQPPTRLASPTAAAPTTTPPAPTVIPATETPYVTPKPR